MANWMKNTRMKARHDHFRASVVSGNQWWDEGKWKVTDILAQESDVIVRFQWWHNAWHTVKVWKQEFDLHILPSGMVSANKKNIITSWCALGIDIGKVNLEQIETVWDELICKSTLNDFLRNERDENWEEKKEKIRVWLIPELEKLKSWWIEIENSGLEISWQVTIIGIHNVILDAFDEVKLSHYNKRRIWSTGSGISRAYASQSLRHQFSLDDLIQREDDYYDSIKVLWHEYKHIFPNITADELIQYAKKERKQILEFIRKWNIKIIRDEKPYIKDLHRKGSKIVWEGAQSSMIGSGNSFYWTASQPSLETFLQTTGLTAEKVWNIFLVHKLPPSSVGTRPGYLKIPESPELTEFRDNYDEYWVSTKRPRDIFHHSMPETARWAYLNVRWIDDESKIVPVYNRIDGLEDALKIDNGLLRAVTWFSYDQVDKIHWSTRHIKVWVHGNEKLSPKNLSRNYPEKSEQAWLFNLDETNLRMIEIKWDIKTQTSQLVWNYNAAIFKKDDEREFLVWTWPTRDDMELRKWKPIRELI